MKTRWDEEEALGQTACLLVECGERGKRCWALHAVLDEIIERIGPSWIAHFLVTTKNKAAAVELQSYLTEHWPAYSELIEQLIAGASWTRGTNGFEKDFGEG
jgi:IS1 family transposase